MKGGSKISALENMRLRMLSMGETAKEESINVARENLNKVFADDPSFKENVEIIDKGIISARINNFRKEGFLSPKMDIQSTLDNEFNLGDLFHFDNQYWLCTMKYNVHGIHYKGEIIQCNNLIRFQLPDSYDIYEKWAVCERPYTRNLTGGEIIQTSDKEYRIRMQLDDITKKMFLKQRIMMGMGYNNEGDLKPDVYTIDSRDATSNAITMSEGFLVLNFVEHVYNPETDNIELQIADYSPKPEDIEIIPDTSDIIAVDGNFDIRIGDSFTQYLGVLYDDNKNQIYDFDNIIFNWQIEANDLQMKYLEIEVDNNNCFLKCNTPKPDKDYNNLLFSDFNLILYVEDLNTGTLYNEIHKNIKIKSLL